MRLGQILGHEIQRHARRPLRGGNGGGAGGRIGLRAFHTQDAVHCIIGQRRKAQDPAPRADRGQQPPQTMRHQQEERPCRWLLQAFQQSIDRAGFQIVRRIDDDRPPGPNVGRVVNRCCKARISSMGIERLVV
jgi:hypothetical protein